MICGSGSSGSVVARRLAENPDVSVLLVEAGGDDDVPNVTDPGRWPTNLGSERDWGFRALPNPRVNGRSIPFSMGKVLGGGSAINGMVWARGHRADWDLFANEAGDPAWGYDSVLAMYRRLEDWHGAPTRGIAARAGQCSCNRPRPPARWRRPPLRLPARSAYPRSRIPTGR